MKAFISLPNLDRIAKYTAAEMRKKLNKAKQVPKIKAAWSGEPVVSIEFGIHPGPPEKVVVVSVACSRCHHVITEPGDAERLARYVTNRGLIGGSILPSSDPSILRTLPWGGRTLQVVADWERDTHHLVLDGTRIASHPNGYSCYALAKRLVHGDIDQTWWQAEYIMNCGGDVHFTREDLPDLRTIQATAQA